ncbi:phospho-N-acetylmuramoyl-pentapeptide-transferase [Rickettsia rickettsii str. 'Sheila Smith']|uniref:Phospho-N-acetylmuramoyl-pentapeptide-transferase n=1 Tax=Rickettsia rickettsii (strain Sheila Smith) TaxID=392021 RepID=A0A0H3AYS5_RICRS|nr:phospho-N-acetylmuramoyl-pentapeptide-transferase [Rickettsia rickettsii str. 'Sheila Smith']
MLLPGKGGGGGGGMLLSGKGGGGGGGGGMLFSKGLARDTFANIGSFFEAM